MTSSTSFPETYDIFTSSDDYATRFASKTGEWFLRVQENITLRMISPYPKSKILDVGGGHGQLMECLLREGHSVTVFSSAPECKKRIAEYIDDGRAEFSVGNILDMPYPDRSFDVVICYRMTAHVNRWEEYLTELARVARYAVMLDYPEVRSVNIISPQLFGVKKHLEPNTRPFRCFRDTQLLDVFRRCGFKRAEKYPQYFIPMMVHRVLKNPTLSSASEAFFRAVGLTKLLGSPVILKVERTT